MRYLLTLILFITLNAFTQDLAIGQWRTHLPFFNVKSSTYGDQKVFVCTETAVFYLDQEDNSVNVYTKVEGLSGVGFEFVSYNEEKEILFICYEDGNIDLMDPNGNITNISAIKEKSVVGKKEMYSVLFEGNLAYLSSSVGIIVIDLDALLILETYIVGNDGEVIEVFSSVIKDQKIFAATREGIKEAVLDGRNLIDYNNWSQHGLEKGIIAKISNDITLFNDTMYMLTTDSIFKYDGSQWSFVYTRKDQEVDFEELYAVNGQLIIQESIDTSDVYRFINSPDGVNFTVNEFDRIVTQPNIVVDQSGRFWVGSLNWGLSEYLGGNIEPIMLDGPASSNVHKVFEADNVVWILPGGIDASWTYKFLNTGLYRYKDYDWSTVRPAGYGGIRDYIDAVQDPVSKNLFFASWHDGLVEMKDGAVVNHYNDSTTSMNRLFDNGPYIVSGLAFDSKDNLWMSNYNTTSTNCIAVKTQDDIWYSYAPSGPAAGIYFVGKVEVDEADQKWIVTKGDGLIIFNDGGTLDDTSDDQWMVLKEGEGKGGLPSALINDIAVDKDGEIWIGTAEGLAVVYCPTSVMDGTCEAQQIVVEYDGYTGHLFEGDNVKSIEVDGANRKWIGTESGVWLISEDGTEQIEGFDIDNSPLISNNIVDIEENGATGEVFFATDLGVISYKSTSTEGKQFQDNDVIVYPNPVRPGYTGLIAIRGLVENAEVKITDVKGNLVYETISLGGQAIWDGNLPSGSRAKSGVYMVWSVNKDGNQAYVTKILLVN